MAAGLTIFLFSFLYKDNPFFKAAEHLYLGAGMGWVFQTVLFQTWIPKVWEPLTKQGDWTVLIPTVLGLTLVTQFFPTISWMSRYGFTFIMGYGSGLVIPLTIYALSFAVGGVAALGLNIETGNRPLQDTLEETAQPGRVSRYLSDL